MNILIYYHSIDLGGQQTQILKLCREFSLNGHTTAWCYEAGDKNIVNVSSHTKTIKISLPFILKFKLAGFVGKSLLFIPKSVFRVFILIKYISRLKIDLIISNDPYGSFLCGIAARISNIKHFRLIGGDVVTLGPGWYKTYQIIKHDKLVDGYFGWDKPYKDYLKKGVLPHKLAKFQANAVDCDSFFPYSEEKRGETKAALKLPAKKIIIGWVGRLEERMQAKFTIELGIQLLNRGFKEFHLLIVGGGKFNSNGLEDYSYPKELEAICCKSGLSNYVTFTGWIPLEKMNEYINAMDVVPLLDMDPQGGSIIREAMACGRVAISVDGISGTQRSFMKADTSILVMPPNFIDACAEKIIELYNDRQLIESMGKQARLYALESMSFAGQAKDIINYYHQKAGIRDVCT